MNIVSVTQGEEEDDGIVNQIDNPFSTLFFRGTEPRQQEEAS
jgi:hypothetical protein